MSYDCFKFYSDIYSKMVTGVLISIVLKLNIPEQLESGPKSIEELTENTNIIPDRLQRYLLQLESSEIFSYDEISKK